MKILNSNKFNEKVKQLDEFSKSEILEVLERLTKSDEQELRALGSKELEGGVFVLKVGDYRIFYTLDTDQSGKNTVMILLDIILTRDRATDIQYHGKKDPIWNHDINPIWNQDINPTWNQNINPIWNQDINPTWNQNINPIWNQDINPIWNQNINPTWNQNINPTWNHSINPKFNPRINPNINPTFSPQILYDLDGNRKEFIIVVTDEIIQFFSFDLKNIKFGVKHSESGYSLFDAEGNTYLGHLESDGQTGYNWFDTNNNWIGYVK